MRKEKVITKLLQKLARLVGEEAERNPEFAEKLGELLDELPQTKQRTKKKSKRVPKSPVPNIYDEWNKRDEADFRLWLCNLQLETLRAIISSNDFDPARRSSRWKDTEKLSTFITDQLLSRMSRGSSFMKHDTKIIR